MANAASGPNAAPFLDGLPVPVLGEGLAARALQRLLELLVYPAIWTAACLGALTYYASTVLDAPSVHAAALVALSALFIYNFDHVVDSHVQEPDDPRARAWHRHPAMLVLLVLTGVLLGLAVGTTPRAGQWVFAAYTSVGLIYGLPLVPGRRRRGWHLFRLKDVPFLKPWPVAGALTLGVVGIPLACSGRPVDRDAATLALILMVFLVSNTHVFDMRDIVSDAMSRMRTLPVVVGVTRVRMALLLLNVFLLALMAWGLDATMSRTHPELYLTPILTIGYLLVLTPRTPKIGYTLLAEGSSFVPLIVLMLRHG